MAAHLAFLTSPEAVAPRATDGPPLNFQSVAALGSALEDEPELRLRSLARLTRAAVPAAMAKGKVDRASDEQLAAYLEGVRHVQGRPFLLIGDSHSYIYAGRDRAGGNFWPADLWMACPGGTAAGLANPNSRLGYGSRIAALLKRIDRLDVATDIPIIIKFGQVDLEFTYQHKRIQGNITQFSRNHFDEFTESVVSRYFSFLENTFSDSWRDRVYVCSIFPPALSDDAWSNGYLNANWQIEQDLTPEQAKTLTEDVRLLEIPNINERTSLHRDYNAKIEAACRRSGFNFLNDFELYVRSANDSIDEFFIGAGRGLDWHVDRTRAANPAAAVLNLVLAESPL